MCLEVKVSSPLLHTLPVEVAVELSSFFSCFLNVLWNLAGFHLLRDLLLHLLWKTADKDCKRYEHKCMCMHFHYIKSHRYHQSECIRLLTEYSLAILCRSLSCSITEYSECLVGYSFIIRSITSSLRRAVRPGNPQKTICTLTILLYYTTLLFTKIRNINKVPDHKCTDLRSILFNVVK